MLNPDRERTGAAVTQPGKLPAIIEPPEGATLQLAVLVVDDPVPDEDAHAEIRIRRAEHGSSRENLKKVKSEAVKQKVLVSIARAMTVRKAPT